MTKAITLIITLLFGINALADTFVVCVGIGNYADARVQPLTKTENDAKAMAEFYKKGTKNVITITGRYATKTKIINSMRSQFSRAKRGDKIVFYFSGHGYPGGFCPYDMTSLAEGLSYSDVVSIMRESKATDKFVFADACFSGGIRQKTKNNQNKPDVGNIVFFLSSRGNEGSVESQLSANGFFTKHLLRGLMGAADVNRDMKITVQEIFSYVSTNVKEQSGDRQHPVMWGNFPNDLTVVRYSKK